VLPPSAISASRARHFVAATLRDAGKDQELVDRLGLVTSELVTNAVIHAMTELEIRVTLDGPSVLLEVFDGASEPPWRPLPAAFDTGGRGLMLVDALVDEWGVNDLAAGMGKRVWARAGDGR
jgi:anti-sigma regulatory factor (Ser/Thr protein kinase)